MDQGVVVKHAALWLAWQWQWQWHDPAMFSPKASKAIASKNNGMGAASSRKAHGTCIELGIK